MAVSTWWKAASTRLRGSPTTRHERATEAWGTAPDDVTAATNAQQVIGVRSRVRKNRVPA